MLKELKKEAEKSKKEGYKLILHIHEIHNLHGLLIATLFGEQKIMVQHHGGSWPLKHLKQTKRYKFFFPLFVLSQVWENLILKKVACFYALSKEETDYLKKVAPDSEIKFQTMGIDEEYFVKGDKRTARRKLNLPQDKKILLYIGRINDIKGVGILLEAMNKLKNENVLLKIIGFGPQEDKFKKYAKENRLDNVEFLGGVFGERKMLYMDASDAFILPSSKEGAPVTVMEALAKNLPVIVTDVGGVSMMIKNQREGIIIPKRNAEEIVKGIREILKWKKRDIRKYANRYRWKEIIKETMKDYLKK
jgi:glycosyltransferase involved in cell wall biosynthesis